MSDTWREQVCRIHARLSALHAEQSKLSVSEGLSAEYIRRGREVLELENQLSAIFWEVLGLRGRSTEVPLSKQPLTPKMEG
jgi:hypothetical protein